MPKFEVTSYLAAKYAALAVETREEQRLARILLHETYPGATKREKYDVLTLGATNVLRRAKWVPYDPVDDVPAHVGYERIGEKATKFEDAIAMIADPDKFPHTLLLVLDATFMLTQPHVPRILLENLAALERNGSTVILAAPSWQSLPASLANDVQILRMDLPTGSDLDEALDTAISAAEIPVTSELREELRGAVTGLPLQKVTNVLCHSFVVKGKWDPVHAADAKMDQVRQSGLLKMANPVPTSWVGGLGEYKRFITQEVVPSYGDPMLGVKRILLVGVQGTGKSLSAKALSSYLNLPVIEANMGRWKGSLVGETERNTDAAFAMINAIGRAVVWFDEIEDQTGDAESSAKTGSTTGAQVGRGATWMEEEQPEGIVAVFTANNFHAIPTKWIRRMDEVFFVDLPSRIERVEIAEVHFGRIGVTPTPELSACVADLSHEWNGDEIRKLIVSAARRAAGKPITFGVLTEAAAVIKPISVTKAAEIAALREWGKSTVRIANTLDAAKTNGKRTLHV